MAEATEIEPRANSYSSAQGWQVMRPLRRFPNGTLVLYASRAGIWRKSLLIRYIGDPPVAAILSMTDTGTIKVVPLRTIRRHNPRLEGIHHDGELDRQLFPSITIQNTPLALSAADSMLQLQYRQTAAAEPPPQQSPLETHGGHGWPYCGCSAEPEIPHLLTRRCAVHPPTPEFTSSDSDWDARRRAVQTPYHPRCRQPCYYCETGECDLPADHEESMLIDWHSCGCSIPSPRNSPQAHRAFLFGRRRSASTRRRNLTPRTSFRRIDECPRSTNKCRLDGLLDACVDFLVDPLDADEKAKFFEVFDVAANRGDYENELQRKLVQLQQNPQLKQMLHPASECRGTALDEMAHAKVAAALINLAHSIQDQRGETASAADALEDKSDAESLAEVTVDRMPEEHGGQFIQLHGTGPAPDESEEDENHLQSGKEDCQSHGARLTSFPPPGNSRFLDLKYLEGDWQDEEREPNEEELEDSDGPAIPEEIDLEPEMGITALPEDVLLSDVPREFWHDTECASAAAQALVSRDAYKAASAKLRGLMRTKGFLPDHVKCMGKGKSRGKGKTKGTQPPLATASATASAKPPASALATARMSLGTMAPPTSRPKTRVRPKSSAADIAKAKKHSRCTICGQLGHWKGDPECSRRSEVLAQGQRLPQANPNEDGIDRLLAQIRQHRTIVENIVLMASQRATSSSDARENEGPEDEELLSDMDHSHYYTAGGSSDSDGRSSSSDLPFHVWMVYSDNAAQAPKSCVEDSNLDSEMQRPLSALLLVVEETFGCMIPDGDSQTQAHDNATQALENPVEEANLGSDMPNQDRTLEVQRPLSALLSVVEEISGCMVLDTACPRSVTGNIWLEDFRIKVTVLGLKISQTPEREVFKFGTGASQVSQSRARLPVAVNGKSFECRVSVCSGALPCLASLVACEQLGLVLDLLQGCAYFLSLGPNKVPLKKTKTGHLCVKITDYPAEYPQSSTADDGQEIFLYPSSPGPHGNCVPDPRDSGHAARIPRIQEQQTELRDNRLLDQATFAEAGVERQYPERHADRTTASPDFAMPLEPLSSRTGARPSSPNHRRLFGASLETGDPATQGEARLDRGHFGAAPLELCPVDLRTPGPSMEAVGPTTIGPHRADRPATLGHGFPLSSVASAGLPMQNEKPPNRTIHPKSLMAIDLSSQEDYADADPDPLAGVPNEPCPSPVGDNELVVGHSSFTRSPDGLQTMARPRRQRRRHLVINWCTSSCCGSGRRGTASHCDLVEENHCGLMEESRQCNGWCDLCREEMCFKQLLHISGCICWDCYCGVPPWRRADLPSLENLDQQQGQSKNETKDSVWDLVQERTEPCDNSWTQCSERGCPRRAIGTCQGFCQLWYCEGHLGACEVCERAPYCMVCANPPNHTCMPTRPPPGAPSAEAPPRAQSVVPPIAQSAEVLLEAQGIDALLGAWNTDALVTDFGRLSKNEVPRPRSVQEPRSVQGIRESTLGASTASREVMKRQYHARTLLSEREHQYLAAGSECPRFSLLERGWQKFSELPVDRFWKLAGAAAAAALKIRPEAPTAEEETCVECRRELILFPHARCGCGGACHLQCWPQHCQRCHGEIPDSDDDEKNDTELVRAWSRKIMSAWKVKVVQQSERCAACVRRYQSTRCIACIRCPQSERCAECVRRYQSTRCVACVRLHQSAVRRRPEVKQSERCVECRRALHWHPAMPCPGCAGTIHVRCAAAHARRHQSQQAQQNEIEAQRNEAETQQIGIEVPQEAHQTTGAAGNDAPQVRRQTSKDRAPIRCKKHLKKGAGDSTLQALRAETRMRQKKTEMDSLPDLNSGTQWPSRPLCACRCGCRRRPSRRIPCPACGAFVGPGCHPVPCWDQQRNLCHLCTTGNPQERNQAGQLGSPNHAPLEHSERQTDGILDGLAVDHRMDRSREDPLPVYDSPSRQLSQWACEFPNCRNKAIAECRGTCAYYLCATHLDQSCGGCDLSPICLVCLIDHDCAELQPVSKLRRRQKALETLRKDGEETKVSKVKSCPRHRRAGQEAGPHRMGEKLYHCGCCAGTCELCRPELNFQEPLCEEATPVIREYGIYRSQETVHARRIQKTNLLTLSSGERMGSPSAPSTSQEPTNEALLEKTLRFEPPMSFADAAGSCSKVVRLPIAEHGRCGAECDRRTQLCLRACTRPFGHLERLHQCQGCTPPPRRPPIWVPVQAPDKIWYLQKRPLVQRPHDDSVEKSMDSELTKVLEAIWNTSELATRSRLLPYNPCSVTAVMEWSQYSLDVRCCLDGDQGVITTASREPLLHIPCSAVRKTSGRRGRSHSREEIIQNKRLITELDLCGQCYWQIGSGVTPDQCEHIEDMKMFRTPSVQTRQASFSISMVVKPIFGDMIAVPQWRTYGRRLDIADARSVHLDSENEIANRPPSDQVLADRYQTNLLTTLLCQLEVLTVYRVFFGSYRPTDLVVPIIEWIRQKPHELALLFHRLRARQREESRYEKCRMGKLRVRFSCLPDCWDERDPNCVSGRSDYGRLAPSEPCSWDEISLAEFLKALRPSDRGDDPTWKSYQAPRASSLTMAAKFISVQDTLEVCVPRKPLLDVTAEERMEDLHLTRCAVKDSVEIVLFQGGATSEPRF